MKTSLKLALLAGVACMLPLAAHAQEYNRLVAFGDSLTDNGNLYTATGGTTPPAPYNHRFTNDLVFAEYLAGSMQGFFTATSYTTGSIDLAFGGSRTDTAVANPPGTPVQLASFLGHGGTFGANDVASMWAGANDIFQGLPTAAGNPSTAAAYMTGVSGTAAANVSAQVGQLATAGAKTIIVMNLPDLGSTPQFNTNADASTLSSYSSSVFNTALDTGLKTVAAAHSGSNIIEVDIKSAFGAIIANPTAFGFADVSHACINVVSCVTGSQDTRNTYLFWDGVHPTAAGHKLVAKLAAQYLYTPTLTEGVGMFADETYNTRRSNQGEIADLLHAGKGSEGEKGYFVQLVGAQGSRDKSIAVQTVIGTTATAMDQKAYDYSMGGFRAGAVTPMSDDTAFGIALTALTGESKGFMVEAKPVDLSVDAGIDWRPGPLFVTVQGGVGVGAYSSYKRVTLVGPMTEQINNINSTSYSASIQAGIDHDMGNFVVTPVARLSYAGAQMSGFSENGPIASVKFGDRKVSATSGAVELRATGKVSGGVSLSGVIGYEAVLSGTEGDLRGQLIGNTAQPFSTDMGKVGSPGVLAGIGLTTHIAGFAVQAQYRSTFGSDSQRDQTGMISFNKSF